MTDVVLSILGILGALIVAIILFLLRSQFSLAKENGKKPCINETLKSTIHGTENKVERLLDMHDTKDQDGVYVWHNSKQLRDMAVACTQTQHKISIAIDSIAESHKRQAELTEKQEVVTKKVMNTLLQLHVKGIEGENNGKTTI